MKEPERAFMDEALGCGNLVASSGELRLSVQVLSAAYFKPGFGDLGAGNSISVICSPLSGSKSRQTRSPNQALSSKPQGPSPEPQALNSRC